MAKKAKMTAYPPLLFWDASCLVAFFATQDRDHRRISRVSEALKAKPIQFITSWPTLSEAATVLLYHYGYSHAAALLQASKAFDILIPSQAEYDQAAESFRKFNADQKISFNDVLTYVFIKGRLKDIPVFSLDKDFSKMGLTVFLP